jgi:hypothetical protein
MFVATWVLGHRTGIVGMAWGLSLGPLVPTVILYVLAWRMRHELHALADRISPSKSRLPSPQARRVRSHTPR